MSHSVMQRLAKLEAAVGDQFALERRLRSQIMREYRLRVWSDPHITEFFRRKSAGNDAEECDIERDPNQRRDPEDRGAADDWT